MPYVHCLILKLIIVSSFKFLQLQFNPYKLKPKFLMESVDADKIDIHGLHQHVIYHVEYYFEPSNNFFIFFLSEHNCTHQNNPIKTHEPVNGTQTQTCSTFPLLFVQLTTTHVNKTTNKSFIFLSICLSWQMEIFWPPSFPSTT